MPTRLGKRKWLLGVALLAGLSFAVALVTLAADLSLEDVAALADPPARNSPESRWIDRWWSVEPDLAAAALGSAAHMTSDQVNNAHLVDLRGVDLSGEFRIESSRQILRESEEWERGTSSPISSFGYPTVVRNVEGRNADGRFYLYYAIHDPYSGIGCAIAERVDASFVKLARLDASRRDSRVLRAPPRPRKTSHFSSPVVTWNSKERLWMMYFHYYSNEWAGGHGHQRTALAVTEDLGSHDWRIWADSDGRYIAPLPTTNDRWMNSQSSYHSIVTLGGDLWFAFLRGTGGEYRRGINDERVWHQYKTKLGFALSRDGRHWAEYAGNPYIHQADDRKGRPGNYRPRWVGFSDDALILAWSEGDLADREQELKFGRTRDLTSIEPVDIRMRWPLYDGHTSAWRDGNRLYLFSGPYQHVIRLPNRATH